MKITDVLVHRLSVPLPRPVRTARHDHVHADTIAVEMRTDAGLTGAGYCFAFGAHRARALAELVEDLAELYKGKAPAPQTRHAEAWRAMNFIGHAGLSLMALTPLDTACWDLAARAANLPLFRFLGGDRSRVPTYASSGLWIDYSTDALLREAESFRAEGHRAMKLRVGRADPEEDVERVRIVREALGGDAALLADVNQGWDEPTAIRVGRRLEEDGLYWLEEPLPYDDLAGCARVAAALDMRVATGETDYGSAGMKRHLEARAADVLMPDLQRMGGPTEFLRAAALCHAWQQPVSSHLFTETSAHLLAAVPNALILEHMGWWEPLFSEPSKIEAGCVVLSEKPGLGVELSQTALKRFRV
ncbi:MAG TPA: mandelate racemase/muconate lactonizing enzyme family protein [Methylomirabilota bacterium]|jgi:L-alanine-DL-glutamate epimerase-like enolase superfamily enzyme|nr:mandelate racemase/muconate lactonizing enzyme family protein [Methylomirabilota bacterium]